MDKQIGTAIKTLLIIIGIIIDAISIHSYKTKSLKKISLVLALLLSFFTLKAQNNWWNKTTAYEVYVRSFFDTNADGKGDFNGLTQKINYLNDGNPQTNSDLGIGLIWLMPINPSPSVHGYDVTDYYKVNPQYGSMSNFRTLLDSAHHKGIKVIMDFVINHTSSQHPWFVKSAANDPFYRNFYRWETTAPVQNGPWGQQVWYPKNGSNYYALFWSEMPDLNYNYQPVRDSIFAIAKYWLKDIGVDGFRLDAVMYLYENGNTLKNTPETISFLKELNDSCEVWKKNSLLVGEVWDNAQTIALYTGKLDMCFDFNLAAANITSANTSNISSARLALNNAQQTLDTNQYGNFLTNHDQNRIFDELGNDINKTKVAASLYLTQPGVPFIYYGEEIAMKGSKPDQYIRTPMQWNTNNYAGFTTGSPYIAVNSNFANYNVATLSTDSNSIFNLYRKLIRVRNNEEVLQLGSVKNVINNFAAVHSYQRTHNNQDLIVLVNTSGDFLTDVQFSYARSDGQSGAYGVEDLMSDSTFVTHSTSKIYDLKLNLNPYQVKILKFLTTTSTTSDKAITLKVYPNPVIDKISILHDGSKTYGLKILNSIGEELCSKLLEPYTSSSISFDYPAGIYFIQLQTEKGTINRKVVKY